MSLTRERTVAALVLMNLALQLFDGVATYVGVQHAGFAEGNPILEWAFGYLGPASALCLFKVEACVCVLLLWRMRWSRLAAPALALSAAVYALCSFGPWTAALAGLI